ncbi:rCG38027, isoform CRA_a [Rattus norvegicus]|uniref:RCG38027, isoform CRA_a n=1 Tax=Rattus norvegicus TaxID=10116 RepID=A6IUZ8_RAT|nr:rCG38027, isoform CRA_a [Rattus norvegicus]EDM07183.1 rCG38027, isoform CRA_a [Rattus norvegicus]
MEEYSLLVHPHLLACLYTPEPPTQGRRLPISSRCPTSQLLLQLPCLPPAASRLPCIMEL